MLFSVCMAEKAESSQCLWCAMLIQMRPCMSAECSWYVVQGGCCCSRKGKCRCQCRYVRWSPVQRARGATVSGMRLKKSLVVAAVVSQRCLRYVKAAQMKDSERAHCRKRSRRSVRIRWWLCLSFPEYEGPPSRPASGRTRVLVRILARYNCGACHEENDWRIPLQNKGASP
jgi:hypothetical protein